ncbi:MAG: hypothetical protein WD009_04515 [Phycisphaeraceae bacterium]
MRLTTLPRTARCLAGVVAVATFLALAAAPAAGVEAAPPDAAPGAPVGPLTPSDGGLIHLGHYDTPRLDPVDRVAVFPARLRELWLEALARPELDLRRQAADAFAEAHRRGMSHVEGVGDALAARLGRETDPAVRLAIVEALDELDHAPAAGAVFAALEQQPAPPHEFALVGDAVLARWGHEPARAMWRDRLPDDAPARATLRLSAIRALGEIADEQAVDGLLAIVQDTAAGITLRVEAAQALGAFVASGLLDAARELAASDVAAERLAAASMLRAHRDADSQALLEELTRDAAPVVVARAATLLIERDPLIVAGHAERLLSDDDPSVRVQAMRALAAQRDAETVALIAAQLGDASVAVRVLGRRTLESWDTDDGLRAAVRQAIDGVLATEDWRALEQAALFVAAVDYTAPADRLIELLRFSRPETRLAVANALRDLSLARTIEPVLAQFEALTEMRQAREQPARVAERGGGAVAIGRETTQLIILLGNHRHEAAEPLLRRYIPKNSGFAIEARGAAIWALGRIYETSDRRDTSLHAALAQRLSDVNPIIPEADRVRRFSAIAMGMMNADDQVRALERFHRNDRADEHVGGACRWALMQITGEDLPPLPDDERLQDQWFLFPVDAAVAR